MPRLLALLTVLVFAAPAAAAPTFGPGSTLLLSRPDGFGGTLPPATDNTSELGSVTAGSDNRSFVVFRSCADDLRASDEAHIFVRDDTTGAVALVDRAAGGGAVGSGVAREASISG